MASVMLASELRFVHTRSSCKLDMPQGSQEEKTLTVAWMGLENLVVTEVRVAMVEGCKVPKQPLHQSDLFEVGLVLVVMVVVDPYYKKEVNI